MVRAFSRRVGIGWVALGLIGSLTVATAATGLLVDRPVRWWWVVSLGTHGTELAVFWAGTAVLCLAWAGLGWRLHRRAEARPSDLVWVGVLWSMPLALGPALFSLDMYSYVAQGAIMAHGLNPYHTPPQGLGQPGLLTGVSSTWQHTTTPYGPLFIGLASLVAPLAGSHLTLAITLLRVPELLGLGLMAWSVPRIARAVGGDPARAMWLALISPLSLLYLVGGGHNDALMVGLMAAGVVLALERRPLAGIALCALAATIKLPAVAAIGMIAICWFRAEPQRWRSSLMAAGSVAAAVVVAAGLATGVGLTWISGSLFSTPATARVALTPSTAVSVTLWEITHHFGARVEQHAATWESAATAAAFVLVGLFALWLCARVRYATLPRYLGLALVAAALGGPAAWPWYLSWGIVMLAADRRAQRSLWLPAALVAFALPVFAGGQVAIPLPDAWVMVLFYAALASAALLSPRISKIKVARPQVGITSIRHAASEPSSVVTSRVPG